MMGWVYMITCLTDFVIFPVVWPIMHVLLKLPQVPWTPLTLQGGGLYHVSMGAILGVTAWGRTQEKLAGVIPGGNMVPSAAIVTTTFEPQTPPPPPPTKPIF